MAGRTHHTLNQPPSGSISCGTEDLKRDAKTFRDAEPKIAKTALQVSFLDYGYGTDETSYAL